MNYARIYNQIVENRLKNPYNGYTEKHHIIPASLGGSDSKDNLVRLTAREHFICHWILVKMYKGNKTSYYKMLKAFNMMCNSITKKQERYQICSRIFSIYREDMSKAMSASQTSKNNSQAGTIWVCNLETKENKKAISGQIPDGWIAGRNKWNTYKPKQKLSTEPKVKPQKKYLNGYSVSVDGVKYDSISHAADLIGIGHETARMRFKSKNFPQYIILSL
jgi:hypothetical protein